MLAVAVLFGLCSLSSIAQEKKSFTLEDLNFGGTNYRNMIPKTQYYKWWGDELVRIDGKEYYLVDKKSGKETLVRNKEKVNEIKQFQKKNERSFVKDNNFYVVGNQGDTIQLTTDGSREIVYGQSVHRNEFGIDGGTFWSPDGQRVAFYRMDQSKVADYPQVNIKARSAAYEPDKYPMAGEQSHDVTIGIYDLKSKNTIYLNTPKSNDTKQLSESCELDNQPVYFTNITWSPDSKTIYMFELNRDQNDCRLVSYDAEKGRRLQELDRETSPKYVEPMHPIKFLPWESSKFLFQSQRDGYNHLYLYDLKKAASTQLTSGKWVVMELVGFNEKAKSVIIASNEISPIQRNLFAVDVKSGRRTLLDNGRGYHSGELSASGQWLRDSYSEPDVPRVIAVTNTQKPSSKTLFTAENPWKDYNVPEYSCGKLKTADGQTDLYYRMVKPVDFDPTKKYPTVIYVYGGPHAHNVDARWHYGSRSWETYMAQKGYLLFILDNRGSENRGRDFEQATFRRLGQVETEDQMQGVKFLQSLPYVDADRIGVHGWSYGGFMTITMMTRHPEIFKVGVAGGPVIDWKWYEVMYGERYMDTPQQNPEGYKEASLIEQAKNLKGKLQIITGYNDDTVVPQHCLSFIYECNKVGTQPDFYVYPLEGHNMRGHQSVHLHERITQYFEDFLK